MLIQCIVDYGDSVCGDRVSFTDSNDVSDWRLSGHLTTIISDVIRLRVLFTLGINTQTSIMFVIYNVQGREPQSFGRPKREKYMPKPMTFDN